MSNLRVLLTITDGCDIEDKDGRQFKRAVEKLQPAPVVSLSCGIGESDVDHHGLAMLAALTGGRHIIVQGSEGIRQALDDLVGRIVFRGQAVVAADAQRAIVASVTQVSAARVPVDLLFLIDCSNSMVGQSDDPNVPGDKLKLSRTKEAAIAVVNSLNPAFDRVGVAQFCGDYRLLLRLTQDFAAVKRQIMGISPGGSTALYSAIGTALDEMLSM